MQHPCQVSFKSMQGCRRSWEDKLKCVKIQSVKGHNSAKICRTWIISPHALLHLWYNMMGHLYQVSFKSMQGCRRSWEDKLKRVNILSVKGHISAKILSNINYLPTCTSTLVVQHPCQVSFKSMQGCRRSWEDKLKCVKILSVKGHNSAKICQTWIISPHALLHLSCNIPANFHSNPCKDVGVWRQTLMGRNDGRTEKANTKCPLAILWQGQNKKIKLYRCRNSTLLHKKT